jgi:hypothetical protein
MLAECVGQLDEPFRRSEIIGWFRRHHPQVNESTLAAHIQAATVNAENRDHNHPYLSRRAPLLRRIDHGLYLRAIPSGPGAATAGGDDHPGTGYSRPAAPPTTAYRPVSARVRDRTRRNIEALINHFDDHVRRFEAAGQFSGPSIYFHDRAIARLPSGGARQVAGRLWQASPDCGSARQGRRSWRPRVIQGAPPIRRL